MESKDGESRAVLVSAEGTPLRHNSQLYRKRRHRVRCRRAHFALMVSIDIFTRKTPQRATRCGAFTYLKRATGLEPQASEPAQRAQLHPRPSAWRPAP